MTYLIFATRADREVDAAISVAANPHAFFAIAAAQAIFTAARDPHVR